MNDEEWLIEKTEERFYSPMRIEIESFIERVGIIMDNGIKQENAREMAFKQMFK